MVAEADRPASEWVDWPLVSKNLGRLQESWSSRLRDKPPPTYKEEEEDELVEEEDELVELDEPIDTFGSDSLDGITMVDYGDLDFDFDSIGSIESSPLVVRGT